ncbi:MAG: hypothetical protein K2J67_03265 [Lachnospiraceae bacterium]|nr:hypothetical protein [Lachnospiraceae bacterium]
MFLGRGITGFFEHGNVFLEESAYSEFQQSCYGFRDKQWDMVCICNPDDTNYYYAIWKWKGQEIYLLKNKYYPVVAFTRGLRLNEKEFVNPPEPFPVPYGSDLVNAEILNTPWDGSRHHLSDGEIQQIQYWKPISLGNIIFNEWD